MKKVYFVGDVHLGIPNYEQSKIREKKLVRWIETIETDAEAIYLMGDLFDFWFEYNHAVPKGYVRILGKLAELTDGGLPVYLFAGNHDLWLKDYFPQELGIPVFHEPQIRTIFGYSVFMGHGDGLGPGDLGYKFMKKCFQNPFLQWGFRTIHPDWGIGLANYFSQKSRRANASVDDVDHGENEWLVQYSKRKVQQIPNIHYFIFGHRHLPKQIFISERSQLVILGDWIQQFSYAVLSPSGIELTSFIE
ncbi:MAG: UDP-2,3-diacylglucosamine diphosphatase [Bacteroidia bacterium]|nr:UDP-2,3-diacylglucosamine diphosphatase [Bacteroidia bacterium]